MFIRLMGPANEMLAKKMYGKWKYPYRGKNKICRRDWVRFRAKTRSSSCCHINVVIVYHEIYEVIPMFILLKVATVGPGATSH